jgi:hypothetical protein
MPQARRTPRGPVAENRPRDPPETEANPHGNELEDTAAGDSLTESGYTPPVGYTELQEIEAKAQAITERIRQLEKLRDLQEQERELVRLLRGVNATPAIPRSSSSDSRSSKEGEIKVRNIRQLKLSADFRTRDEWLSDLQRAFNGAPRKFRKQYRQILFALDNMDSECRTRWE